MGYRLSVCLLFASLCIAPAQSPRVNPFANDADAAEAGRAQFRLRCAPCHGFKGEGGRGPNLTLGTYNAGNTDEDLFRVIWEGVPGSEMPGYEGRMTEDETWKFVSFIRSIARREEVELKGDKSRGEALYSGKGGCASCHQINRRGGRIGPDLSRAGRARSAPFLRESLVEPNKYLSSGYNTITVVKNDGSKIVGVEMNIDNFSVQLMDASEKYYSFLRSEVRSVSREFKSMMPAYGQSLSESEIDDLVAYMAGLRGEEGTK